MTAVKRLRDEVSYLQGKFLALRISHLFASKQRLPSRNHWSGWGHGCLSQVREARPHLQLTTISGAELILQFPAVFG